MTTPAMLLDDKVPRHQLCGAHRSVVRNIDPRRGTDMLERYCADVLFAPSADHGRLTPSCTGPPSAARCWCGPSALRKPVGSAVRRPAVVPVAISGRNYALVGQEQLS